MIDSYTTPDGVTHVVKTEFADTLPVVRHFAYPASGVDATEEAVLPTVGNQGGAGAAATDITICAHRPDFNVLAEVPTDDLRITIEFDDGTTWAIKRENGVWQTWTLQSLAIP